MLPHSKFSCLIWTDNTTNKTCVFLTIKVHAILLGKLMKMSEMLRKHLGLLKMKKNVSLWPMFHSFMELFWGNPAEKWWTKETSFMRNRLGFVDKLSLILQSVLTEDCRPTGSSWFDLSQNSKQSVFILSFIFYWICSLLTSEYKVDVSDFQDYRKGWIHPDQTKDWENCCCRWLLP